MKKSMKRLPVPFFVIISLISVMIVFMGCGVSDLGTGPAMEGGGLGCYYVSPSGNDDYPGTSQDSSWATIGRACNTLIAGDTVYVRSGTYNERVVPRNSGSSSSERIVYMTFPNEYPVIDGTGVSLPSEWAGLVQITGKSHIDFINFQVRNAGSDMNHSGILVEGATDITINNCNTYNTVSSGIGVWNSSEVILSNNEVELACNDGEQECITVAETSNFEVRYNLVHNSGPSSHGGEGIDIKDGCFDGEVYGNVVHDINRLGIYVDSWDKPTHDINVYGNLVYNTEDDGFAIAAEAGGLLSNISIYNNIAYGNTNSGLTVASWGEPVSSHPMNNISIINNTFYGNGNSTWGVGICLDNSDADNIVVRNNIMSENGVGQLLIEHVGSSVETDFNLYFGPGETYGTDNVEADPDFLDASSGNFHLKISSPAIDAGSADGAPSTDYEGTSRPHGGGFDVGAYEQ